jgi:hypothetical protein
MKIKYKFKEDELIEELKEYIDNTYDEHYATSGKIQSLEVIFDRGFGRGFCHGNIDKYNARYGKKEGDNRKDLQKILHYALLALYEHDRTHLKQEKDNHNFSKEQKLGAELSDWIHFNYAQPPIFTPDWDAEYLFFDGTKVKGTENVVGYDTRKISSYKIFRKQDSQQSRKLETARNNSDFTWQLYTDTVPVLNSDEYFEVKFVGDNDQPYRVGDTEVINWMNVRCYRVRKS